MKNTNSLAIILLYVAIIVTSCSPQSKESYLQRYKTFLSEAKTNCSNYTEEDWIKSDEEFKLLSEEWYSKFEEELTWKEEVLLAKYSIQYNALKSKTEIIDIYNLFFKEDYESLKRQIKEYSENDMKEDIEFLVRQADEIGEEAIIIIDDILKELELNIENFENK